MIAPEGVQLRTSPRASTSPVARTSTPTSGSGYSRANPPADDTTAAAFARAQDPTGPHKTISPPVRQTGEQRAVTPSSITGQHRIISPTNAPSGTARASGTTTPPLNHPAFARTETPNGRTPTPQNLAARVPTPTPSHLQGRVPTGNPVVGRTMTGAQQPRAASPSTSPVTARTMTPVAPRAASPGGPVISRTISTSRAQEPPKPVGVPPRSARPSQSPMPVRSRTNTAAQLETEALIRDRLALVDRGADHFVLLGIAQDATPDLIRAAYFTLARKLHPDRLASLGIVDSQRDAQRLFAQINTAFAVLNDQVKRLEYLQILERGGESAVKAEEAKADAQVMKVMHAEEAFRRGEMALRREQLDQAITEFTTAVELQPQEPEYIAMLVWAKFAAAPDKQTVAHKTRIELQRAAERALQSPTARFYLGRVERILGREREALEHFYEVLRIKPNHAEASSEIRVLETRLKKR
ncbi:MAG: DnaJ domain-containing protein [Kofleriaceae bacterium]